MEKQRERTNIWTWGEGRRERMRRLDGTIDSMEMSLSKSKR